MSVAGRRADPIIWPDSFRSRPGLLDWFRAKAMIVTRFIAACAETAKEASGGRIRLMPQAFPPPWSMLSGFDFSAVAGTGVCAIGVKLYTMHWPMIVRSYGDSLVGLSPALAADHGLADGISRLFGMRDEGERFGSLQEVRYPEPEEPHPAGALAQAAKIRQAQAEAGDVPVHAFAHGYGPLDDVAARAKVAFEAAGGRCGSTATAICPTPSSTPSGSRLAAPKPAGSIGALCLISVSIKPIR